MNNITTKDEVLIMLKSFLEGTNDCSFKKWFGDNESYLKLLLPRAEFLRLKFEPFAYAGQQLTKHNIAVNLNQTSLNRQYFLFHLSPNLLDEMGELDFNAFLEINDGLPKAFFNHNLDKFYQIIKNTLDNAQPNFDRLSDETSDFLFFIEICHFAYPEFALAMIDEVIQYFNNNDVYFTEILEIKQRMTANVVI